MTSPARRCRPSTPANGRGRVPRTAEPGKTRQSPWTPSHGHRQGDGAISSGRVPGDTDIWRTGKIIKAVTVE